MNVEDVIAKLQKFPPHFEVQAILISPEMDDLTAGFLDVINYPHEKVVYLELANRLLSD